MDKEKFFYLGKISETFGYKGQVIVITDSDHPDKYEKLEFVFVDIEHERVPFFITEFSLQYRNSITLKFEDIDSSDSAQKLLGCEVYIAKREMKGITADEAIPADLVGFKVTDVNSGFIGPINQILKLPQQLIMQILQDEKEILIPLNEDFIKKIDQKKKTILIDAPEGLIDFYRK